MSHFDWFLPMIYDLLEDRRTIDVIITEFLPLCFMMAESFENLYNIPRGWAKDEIPKKSCREINPFLWEKRFGKKYPRSLSRQPSGTKPSTKLVLESQEPLLYLEFNKSYKQNVSEINLLKKLNFSQSKNNCWHTDRCQGWNIKSSLLKSVKIITQPYLNSQRCEYSSPFQSTAAN